MSFINLTTSNGSSVVISADKSTLQTFISDMCSLCGAALSHLDKNDTPYTFTFVDGMLNELTNQ